MKTWVVGDVQGCHSALLRLLDACQFDPSEDRLVFTGDLVNRGPDSLASLRFILQLGSSASSVLGNHDLHLLAIGFGAGRHRKKDTLRSILDAPDRPALFDWLLNCPLMIETEGHLIVHAGIPPQWTIDHARNEASATAQALRQDPEFFFRKMYGDHPNRWDPEHKGMDRYRFAINALTRMRYLDPKGRMNFKEKGTPGTAGSELIPWFSSPYRKPLGKTVLFGHWSTLNQIHWPNHQVVGLDTGCVWGGQLTAFAIETGQLISCA